MRHFPKEEKGQVNLGMILALITTSVVLLTGVIIVYNVYDVTEDITIDPLVNRSITVELLRAGNGTFTFNAAPAVNGSWTLYGNFSQPASGGANLTLVENTNYIVTSAKRGTGNITNVNESNAVYANYTAVNTTQGYASIQIVSNTSFSGLDIATIGLIVLAAAGILAAVLVIGRR